MRAFQLDRGRVRVLEGLSFTFCFLIGCMKSSGLLADGCELGFPGEKANFFTGARPIALAVVDLNGDGRLDVVTANGGSRDVSVLLGNGDGTFQPEKRLARDSSPRALAAADLNGDGRADLVTANDESSVLVLLGNGDGTFQAQKRF